ncbi:hypothetical protein MWN33_05225 [Starkeya koreensis]|uniref:Band 7 domain-containing protein n=1 Tax=Ancylobacter koreensis TaxID=266121 RepID=A0ABT0DJH8_9HYPH|nr:hypothetical protein [Ancylobacter koreensis]MCK0207433.1 hypothetical protein [Ancylobacter koreensis]
MALFEGPDSRLPSFRAGFVVVAAGPKGIRSLANGARLTWGERVFGGYNAFYYVDIGVNSYTKSIKCSSKAIGIDFDVVVRLSFTVEEPTRVVQFGLGDPEALFGAPVHRLVADAVSRFTVDQSADAKKAVDIAFKKLAADPAVKVLNATSEVKADAAALPLLRTIAEEGISTMAHQATARLDKARRDEILALLDSPNHLLAQSMITRDPAFREALNYKLTELNSDRQRQIDLLKMLIAEKIIEPHDFEGRYRPLIEAAMATLRGPILPAPEPPVASIAAPPGNRTPD